MGQKSYLLLLASFFTLSYSADQPPTDIASLAVEAAGSAPVETTSWWDLWGKTKNVVAALSSSATKETVDRAEDIVREGTVYMAAIVDHAEMSADRAFDKAGKTMQSNLKAAFKPVFCSALAIIAAYFAAKFTFQGVNDYFKEDDENKAKSKIKIGLGGTCFAVATCTVLLQFK